MSCLAYALFAVAFNFASTLLLKFEATSTSNQLFQMFCNSLSFTYFVRPYTFPLSLSLFHSGWEIIVSLLRLMLLLFLTMLSSWFYDVGVVVAVVDLFCIALVYVVISI